MINLHADYRKYRWFFTHSGKLVVGGKNAQQNEELLHHLVKSKAAYLVMHTRAPGSPFCILVAPISSLTKQDYEECAIFTGCFSRAWRAGKKEALIDIFKTTQLHKEKGMNAGTWGVRQPVEHRNVMLRLALMLQHGILRAVPEMTPAKKEVLILLCPGSIDKRDISAKLALEQGLSFTHEEIMAALPAGGSKICRV